MADDVMFNFGINDRASGTLKKIKREADGAQKSMGGISNALRLGGEKFGKIAEGGEKFGKLSGAMMGVGVAVLAVSAAYNVFAASSDRAVGNAKEQVEWQGRLREEIERTKKANDQLYAGSVSQAPDVRKLLGRGGSLDQVEKIKLQGIEHSDALKGEADLLMVAEKRRENIRKSALAVARLGEGGYSEMVKKLNVLPGQMTPERALVIQRGTMPGNTLAAARASLSRLDNVDQPGLRNIDTAMTNAGVVPGIAAGSLVSGQAQNAIGRQNQDIVNQADDPRGFALNKVREQAEKTAVSLRAAADAQSSLVAFIRDSASLVGMSQGSERAALNNFQRNSRVGSN